MNEHITEVFNPYNINILFTVAALPSRVSQEWQLMQIQMKNQAQIQKHDKENSLSMPDVIATSSVNIKAAVTKKFKNDIEEEMIQKSSPIK